MKTEEWRNNDAIECFRVSTECDKRKGVWGRFGLLNSMNYPSAISWDQNAEYRRRVQSVIKEREYGVASGCWTKWTTHQPFHEIKMLNTEEEYNYSPAPLKAARFSTHALSREQQCLLHHLLQVASWLEQIAHQLCCPWSSPQCRHMPPLQ